MKLDEASKLWTAVLREMPRIVNKGVLLLASLLLGASALACATNPTRECAPVLTKETLRQIVEAEIRRMGGEPKPGRSTRVTIKRDGCDYIYREISIPKRPGGIIVVRINQVGEVVDFLPGL